MEPNRNNSPHVIVDLAMSDAEFDIKTGQKLNGGLGPDERYVLRWFNKSGTLTSLQETWKVILKSGRKEIHLINILLNKQKKYQLIQ